MSTATPVIEPFPIFSVSDRFFLYDVNVVSHVRATHHICGTLAGTLAQIPQQNLFLGLPLELMHEEVKLLLEKDAAYIVDDAAAHEDNLKSMMDADKAVFLATREEAMDADALTRQAAVDAKKAQYARDHNLPFSSTSTSELIRFHTIPTASSPSLYRSENKNCEIVPRPNEAAYEIYRFLQGKGYYLSPGLRFGCMFMAYPGDPLRFHSHFLVNGYGWEEGVPLVDLVAGGRLGTGVKKAWMFGGRKPDFGDKEGEVRSFCVEWGGF